MKRVNDYVVESAIGISESDTLKRNPLRVSYGREFYDNRDRVIVDDNADDVYTLDGKINSRGRADTLRSSYVDKGRHFGNRDEICNTFIPMLQSLSKKLELERFYDISRAVDSIIDSIENEVRPDYYDVEKLQGDVRKPIYVGDRITKYGGYYGHKPAWSN